MNIGARVWAFLSGTLGAHLFGMASEPGFDSWWRSLGSGVSAVLLVAAVRHPHTRGADVRDQQVLVHDVDDSGKARVLALLGRHGEREPDVGWPDGLDGELADPSSSGATTDPWVVVSRLTRRRADQVVAYLKDFGLRAERSDDPRVKLHLGVLRALPVTLGFGVVLLNGSGVLAGTFPPVVRNLASVATWLAVVAVGYVVADLAFASRPARRSDWEPELEVTGPYDVELRSLPQDDRGEVLEAFRLVVDLDPRHAVSLLHSELPTLVHTGLSRVEAERLVSAVNAAGGAAAVVRRAAREPEAS